MLHLFSNAQTSTTWNGKSCAVVLTYDDGLNIDLSNVVPALDSVGLKGTFYISDYFDGLKTRFFNGEKLQKKDMNWEITLYGTRVKVAVLEENL